MQLPAWFWSHDVCKADSAAQRSVYSWLKVSRIAQSIGENSVSGLYLFLMIYKSTCGHSGATMCKADSEARRSVYSWLEG